MSTPQTLRVGFTGTREGMTQAQADTVKLLLSDVFKDAQELHYGDCVGADADFARIAAELGQGERLIAHPPVDGSQRAFTQAAQLRPEKPYLDRDRDIVDESDVLIACPKTAQQQERGGTWYTIRYARSRNKTVLIIKPSGDEMEKENHVKSTSA